MPLALYVKVYVNGRVDNGCLLGEVSNKQRVSGLDTYVGRRANSSGYEFAGAIDDVRIYSRALEEKEILSDMGTSSKGERYLETPNYEIRARNETLEQKICHVATPIRELMCEALPSSWPLASWSP